MSHPLVILAGGLGTRMREETEFLPKPMVKVGTMPVMLHIMRWYAKFGVTRFIIAGGYKIESIRNYFASFPFSQSDFKWTSKGVEILGANPYENWEISVVDTGVTSNTGERIRRLENLLAGETFLCTYGDGLSNVDIGKLVQSHYSNGKTATMTITRPSTRFGVVEAKNQRVTKFREKPVSLHHVNIGHFVFEASIFDFVMKDEALEELPMKRLVGVDELAAFEHEGFFEPMDTYREFIALNKLWDSGQAKWR